MKNKLFKLKKFLTTLTNKQKIVAVGIVCITSILIGSLVIFIGSNKEASVNFARESSKSKKLDQHLKTDKTQKAKSDEQAKLKAEADKKAEADQQAKIKAETEAKTKADNEAKAKAEAEQAQAAQAEQAKAQQEQQAQAVSEQTSTQATPQQSYQPSYVADNSQATPSYTAPNQGNGGGATTPATPTAPSTPTVSDDQKWLNAGYIRAPFPEGSGELANWLADRGYGGYTGNGEGWIRPY